MHVYIHVHTHMFWGVQADGMSKCGGEAWQAVARPAARGVEPEGEFASCPSEAALGPSEAGVHL